MCNGFIGVKHSLSSFESLLFLILLVFVSYQGYLYSEVKIQIENFIMAIAMVLSLSHCTPFSRYLALSLYVGFSRYMFHILFQLTL